MSLHHNPRIVTDGLVFAYDMDNTAKSWKGKPTENLVPDPLFSQQNWSTWSGRGADSWSYDTFSGETTVYTDLSINTGERHQLYKDITVSSSLTTFALSIDVYVTLDCDANSILANQEYPFGNNYGSLGYDLTKKGTWQRLYAIRDNAYTGDTSNIETRYRFYFGTSNTTGSQGKIYFKNAQLEEGSFATPFVNGTRSNTQALLDISKSKNTVTATSLTYNSDGTFQFNNNNYLSLNTGITGSNFTVLMWHYNGASSFATAGHRTFLSTNNLRFQWDDTPDRGPFVDFNSGSGGGQANFGSSLTPANFLQKYTMVGLVGGSTVKTTFNDVTSGQSSTISGARNFSSNGNVSIGIDNLSGIGGSDHINRESSVVKMPLIQIYNRALTAAEIKQNFNATRGRFGI